MAHAEPDFVIEAPKNPPKWRLILVLAGSCIFLIGLSLGGTGTVPPSMAKIVQQIGVGIILIGIVWGIGRIVAHEWRRHRRLTPLQRSAEDAAHRRYRYTI